MFIAGMLTDVFPATVLIMGFTIAGAVLIFQVRRKIQSPSKPSLPFTISELEKLRDEGSLSEEEFEFAKQSINDLTKGLTTDSQKKPPRVREKAQN